MYSREITRRFAAAYRQQYHGVRAMEADEEQNHHHVQLPTIKLPTSLDKSLKNVLSAYPRKNLIAGGQSMMKHLYSRKPWGAVGSRLKHNGALEQTEHTIRYNKTESILYAASRVQSCYGATLRVLKEVADCDPSFKPKTLLDFGSGLGTVSWAANEIWGNTLYEHQAIDVSSDMGELADSLRRGGSEPSSTADITESVIPGVYFKRYLPSSNNVSYDIVVAAYSLSELSNPHKLREIIASLWMKTDQYIVLIEQGNLRGFDVILRARDHILKAREWRHRVESYEGVLEGHVVAPCPHDLECPVSNKMVCAFDQNVSLSLAQENIPILNQRGVSVENFSYVVIRKGVDRRDDTSSAHSARIILPVKSRTKHAICSVCVSDGKACHVTLSKGKDRELYKFAKKKKLGDTLQLTDDQIQRRSTRDI